MFFLFIFFLVVFMISVEQNDVILESFLHCKFQTPNLTLHHCAEKTEEEFQSLLFSSGRKITTTLLTS